MAGKSKGKGEDDPLRAYRRVRKPLPPPERVVPDRRRKAEEEQAKRRIRERE